VREFSTQATTAAHDVFFAIADPTRRAVLDLLIEGPRNAGDIASEFPRLTQPGVSRHLQVLREAQLVTVTIDAQQRVYALKREGLDRLQEWIARYQDFWSDKLDALESHLSSTKTRKEEAAKRK